MIQDIEKYIIADRYCTEEWNRYCAMIPAIEASGMIKPSIDAYAKATRVAGYAYRRTNRIWINTAYFDGSDSSKKSFVETVAHELAHCITWKIFPECKQAHGSEFRWVMNQIGYDGATYHAMSVSKAKDIAAKHKDELFNLD